MILSKKKSSKIAKERISFVLDSDRLSLSPEQLENLKKDFSKIVLKYVKLDQNDLNINIRREGKKTIIIAEFYLKQN